MNRFAQSNDEAGARYLIHKSKDPFPNIEPALLNSADIEDYVAAAGMIYPFDPKKLISASYEVPLEGDVYFWTSCSDERIIEPISRAGGFSIRSNSIAYIWLRTHFRIPDYIALRFNLLIKHVHRGILLGTGPLVDPGFEGRLLVPLHNLTANEHRISSGEGLIWVEFTKISKNALWSKDVQDSERLGVYRPFPDEKRNLDPTYYFEKAAGGSPIRSSIPKVIQDAARMATSAKDSAEAASTQASRIREEGGNQISSIKEEWRKQISRIQLITLIASFVAICAIIVTIVLANRTTLLLVENSIKYVNDLHKELQVERAELLERISTIEDKLQSFEKNKEEVKGNEEKVKSLTTDNKRLPSIGNSKNE